MCVLDGEATNVNFIVFGLTPTGFEPTIYLERTLGEHANHYTTDVVLIIKEVLMIIHVTARTNASN